MPRKAKKGLFSHWPYPYCPRCSPYGLPPWRVKRPSREEEIEEVRGHIKFLKEELEAAEKHLEELEASE